jgi:hypothetical protein
MALFGALPLIGAGLGFLGNLFTGSKQSSQQSQIQRLMIERMRMLDNLAMQNRQIGPSSWENMLADAARRSQYAGQQTFNPNVGPMQLAQADLPQMVDPFRSQFGRVSAQQIGGIPDVVAQQIFGTNVNADQLNVNDFFRAGGGAFNASQDALMQALRRDPAAQIDPTRLLGGVDLTGQLGGLLTTGGQQSTDDVLRGLDVAQQRAADQALAQLQGSAGSLGQRFGTTTLQRSGDLLAQLNDQYGLQRAQVALGAAENAQNRRLQAGGILAGLEGQRAGDILNAQGLQLQAAQLAQFAPQLAAQLGLANQDAALRAALANQATGLAAGQSNQEAMLRAALANQGMGFNVQQANQAAGLQAGLANQDALMQSLLANQAAQMGTSQFNAGAFNTAALQQQQLQAAANQFGAQFNAQQAQLPFQQMLQAAGLGSSLQQSRLGANNQLLAIMAGLAMPQPNTAAGYAGGALGQLGQFIGLYPFMQQLFPRG